MFFLSPAIIEKLEEWDRALFNLINNGLDNPVFDAVMPVLRISYVWVPFYLFIVVFVCVNYKVKGLWWFIFFILVVACADMIGTNVFKHNVQRIRPCNIQELFPNIRVRVVCPSGYGFTPNHAANHFGMAMYIFLTFRHIFKKHTAWIFLWAGAICYAQIYVGVHYPSDIVGGALLGFIFAGLFSFLYHKFFGKLPT